jgi:hypothetical protein
MPRKVSPGSGIAKKTAAFAEAPEWGCTFANLALKSSFALSIAGVSAPSTCSQPP